MSINENRFSLRNIIYLFILLDIFLLYYVGIEPVMMLVAYEATLIFGLLLGLRGQGKFKQIMINLEGIARNKKLSIDEREHKLVMGVHHHFLELGYLYEERNKEYGLHKKKQKKTKNKRGVKSMALKEKTIIEIMRAIALMWVSFGLGLTDILIYFGLSPLWIMAIVGVYYVIDLFFWLIMENEYGIFREEIDDG